MVENRKNAIGKQFIKYVSQNVFGMLGISLYILADTYFISRAVGADGITALNLVLPIYSLIFAFGQMIGVGSSIRFAVAKGQGKKEADYFFGNALFFGTLFAVIFIFIGLFAPDQLLKLLGANAVIQETGRTYTRIFMCFAPAFVWNHICNAFVRNDGNPSTAMLATLLSSLFNIVFDYVLMFPMGLGMAGAALATAISPLLGVMICLTHFLSGKSTVRLSFRGVSISRLWRSCQVGVSAFVGELSSAVITMVFNYIILDLAGNMGVAAYGVIANTALVAMAMLNGVAQGAQPLISDCYGKGANKEASFVIRSAILTALVLGLVLYAGTYPFAAQITAVFNSEGIAELETYAVQGIRIYFIGFVFAGINIVGALALSAQEKASEAFVISVSRGFVLILLFAFLLSRLWGLTGVWMSFPVTELATTFVVIMGFAKKNKS